MRANEENLNSLNYEAQLKRETVAALLEKIQPFLEQVTTIHLAEIKGIVNFSKRMHKLLCCYFMLQGHNIINENDITEFEKYAIAQEQMKQKAKHYKKQNVPHEPESQQEIQQKIISQNENAIRKGFSNAYKSLEAFKSLDPAPFQSQELWKRFEEEYADDTDLNYYSQFLDEDQSNDSNNNSEEKQVQGISILEKAVYKKIQFMQKIWKICVQIDSNKKKIIVEEDKMIAAQTEKNQIIRDKLDRLLDIIKFLKEYGSKDDNNQQQQFILYREGSEIHLAKNTNNIIIQGKSGLSLNFKLLEKYWVASSSADELTGDNIILYLPRLENLPFSDKVRLSDGMQLLIGQQILRVEMHFQHNLGVITQEANQRAGPCFIGVTGKRPLQQEEAGNYMNLQPLKEKLQEDNKALKIENLSAKELKFWTRYGRLYVSKLEDCNIRLVVEDTKISLSCGVVIYFSTYKDKFQEELLFTVIEQLSIQGNTTSLSIFDPFPLNSSNKQNNNRSTTVGLVTQNSLSQTKKYQPRNALETKEWMIEERQNCHLVLGYNAPSAQWYIYSFSTQDATDVGFYTICLPKTSGNTNANSKQENDSKSSGAMALFKRGIQRHLTEKSYDLAAVDPSLIALQPGCRLLYGSYILLSFTFVDNENDIFSQSPVTVYCTQHQRDQEEYFVEAWRSSQEREKNPVLVLDSEQMLEKQLQSENLILAEVCFKHEQNGYQQQLQNSKQPICYTLIINANTTEYCIFQIFQGTIDNLVAKQPLSPGDSIIAFKSFKNLFILLTQKYEIVLGEFLRKSGTNTAYSVQFLRQKLDFADDSLRSFSKPSLQYTSCTFSSNLICILVLFSGSQLLQLYELSEVESGLGVEQEIGSNIFQNAAQQNSIRYVLKKTFGQQPLCVKNSDLQKIVGITNDLRSLMQQYVK